MTILMEKAAEVQKGQFSALCFLLGWMLREKPQEKDSGAVLLEGKTVTFEVCDKTSFGGERLHSLKIFFFSFWFFS